MARPPLAPGGRRVDLHTHTSYSDGSLPPEAVVRLAIERRLAALAITDHDSVEALPAGRAAAGLELELVPGIEISSSLSGLDLHILGYFIDPADPALALRLERFRIERLERVREMVARLAALGADVDVAEVMRLAGHGVVGRPHVAEALVSAGHADDTDDAFRRYLGSRGVAFVPRPSFRPDEAIALIHDAGGVSVLAHPGPGLVDSVVESLAAQGLRGIEVWHPQHSPVTVRRYEALAERLGLLVTGGSDFHGPGRSTGLGDLPVPLRVLEPLKRAAGVTG
jgi:predicted metal-dependent phosphoesterase TrpH